MNHRCRWLTNAISVLAATSEQNHVIAASSRIDGILHSKVWSLARACLPYTVIATDDDFMQYQLLYVFCALFIQTLLMQCYSLRLDCRGMVPKNSDLECFSLSFP
jgi:hypothetical protein